MNQVHGVAKSRTQLSNFRFHFHSLRQLCIRVREGKESGIAVSKEGHLPS